MARHSTGQQRREICCRINRLRVGLGTFVSLEAEASTHQIAKSGIDRAWTAIRRIEKLLHPARPGSDLQRIGKASPGEEIEVDAWTYELLEIAHRVHAATKGVFDPCLPVLRGRLSDLELLDANRVRAHRPLSLDLGGIAKGYAVDRAVHALREAGCSAGLVNAGGDLRGFGRLRLIRCLPIGRAVRLWDGALAASQPAAPARPSGHRGYYRRITGDTRRSRVRPLAVAVVRAPTAALADALTKYVLLGPATSQQGVLRQFGARALLRAPEYASHTTRPSAGRQRKPQVRQQKVSWPAASMS